jgi:hypothetical protein
VTGQRTWDYSVDGVAHYGMIPDWVADLTGRAPALTADLLGGAESYLRTMQRAQGWQIQPNLARGKSYAASSTEWSLWGAFAAGKAADGNWSSRWASPWKPTAWWQVDLGAVQPVGRVGVDWEAAHARRFEVQVSSNGSTWQTVWATDGQVMAGQGGIDTAVFTPTPARDVRITGLERGTPYGYSIWEVGVHAR